MCCVLCVVSVFVVVFGGAFSSFFFKVVVTETATRVFLLTNLSLRLSSRVGVLRNRDEGARTWILEVYCEQGGVGVSFVFVRLSVLCELVRTLGFEQIIAHQFVRSIDCPEQRGTTMRVRQIVGLFGLCHLHVSSQSTTTTTTTLTKPACQYYFGENVNDSNVEITVVDPDVFDGYPVGNLTYMHHTGVGSECISPAPPAGCHRYFKVW